MGLNRTWLVAIDSSRGYGQSLPELSGQMKRKAVWWPVPLLRPEPTAQEFLFRLDRRSLCLLLPGAGRWERAGSLVLPCSPACAGQCLRNQPGPHCWRNSGFAFKEGRYYQNYFNHNHKVFGLLSPPVFFIFPGCQMITVLLNINVSVWLEHPIRQNKIKKRFSIIWTLEI